MVDEANQLLPIANVGKIMRQALPPPSKISKEAKVRMQECATEFIRFVTGEASDKCQKENRKTVNGEDICWALSSLGLDNYAEAITRYVHRYREYERVKARQKGLGFAAGASNEDKEVKELAAAEGTSRRPEETQLIEKQVEGGRSPFEFRILEKGN